jgi:hypothetical protein
MQQTQYNPTQASVAPPRSYTPAVTTYTYTPEEAEEKSPPDPASYYTMDNHSIIISKGDDGFVVNTPISGSPEDELRAEAPRVGRSHTEGTKFTLYPDGKDGEYHLSINYIPACVQTKHGQSTIYTLRNEKVHVEGPYPAQPRQLAPPTCIDPSLILLDLSPGSVPPSFLKVPIQSSLADKQTGDGPIIDALAINRHTSAGNLTTNQGSDHELTIGTAPNASEAYDNRPGRRLASHRGK